MHQPTIIPIINLSDAEKAIQDIGCDPHSIPLMAPKMVSRVIKLHNIVLKDAIIVKQDMLSIGGEVAVPKETFELHEKTASILICGNMLQLRTLVQKLKRHYPRINTIAIELETMIEEIE